MHEKMIALLQEHCLRPLSPPEVSRRYWRAIQAGDADQVNAVEKFARYTHMIDW